MRSVKYIKGMLMPNDPSIVTEATYQNIRRAVDKVGFFEARRAMQKWKQGIITLNFVNIVCGGEESVMDFIGMMDRFVTLRGVEELGLEGTINLLMDGETDPVMFRVHVREGAVTYQQAINTIWTNETLILH